MRGVGVLGVGLLLAMPVRAQEPAGAPAYEIYGWLSTGVSAEAVNPSSSLWVSGNPDAQALAAGAMATLGANLAPNPLAACWVQFPVAATAVAGAKPDLGGAAAVVALAGGPLVLYGGRPGVVGNYPGPLNGPYPNLPLRAGVGTSPGGVPLVTGGPATASATLGDPPFALNTDRGVSDLTGATIPPGGWTALTLDAGPVAGSESGRVPAAPALPTVAPANERAPIATPEPTTLVLAGLGLGALAGTRRRPRRA